MTISRRLAAHREAVASAAAAPCPPNPLTDPENEVDEIEDKHTTGSKPEKDKDMTQEEIDALKADARKEGYEAANARFTAVTSSEHYAGRETLAKTLLATELSAEQIITSLAAAAPAAAAPAASGDDAQREEMLNALAKNKNAPLESGSDAGTPEADADKPDNSLVDGMKARFNLNTK